MDGCSCPILWAHFGVKKVLFSKKGLQSLGETLQFLAFNPSSWLSLRPLCSYRLCPLSFSTSSFGFDMPFGAAHVDKSHPSRSVPCPSVCSATAFPLHFLCVLRRLRVRLVHLQSFPLGRDLLTSVSFEVADYTGPKIAKNLSQTTLDE